MAITTGEEEIRGLLRGAGPRPPIPARDHAVIKAAARAEWRELAEANRARGRAHRVLLPLALAASLLLALVIGWRWIALRPPVVPQTVATVELLAGVVRAQGPEGQALDAPLELGTGFAVVAGSELATLQAADGSPAYAALSMAGGHSVRLAADSRVRLLSDTRLDLVWGAVYVDSGSQASGAAAIEVLTPYGSVLERGTQFEVRVGEGNGMSLRVRVREGAVDVRRGSESHAAAKGEELTVHADGSVDRGAVEIHGSTWDWILAAAPSLDIEGLSLESFLDWVSRETGWRVRYADGALAETVAATRLHGTIEGLTPGQSVDVVLPGSGLSYRVEDGILTISVR